MSAKPERARLTYRPRVAVSRNSCRPTSAKSNRAAGSQAILGLKGPKNTSTEKPPPKKVDGALKSGLSNWSCTRTGMPKGTALMGRVMNGLPEAAVPVALTRCRLVGRFHRAALI